MTETRNIIGTALTPIEGDQVALVEGTLGNAVRLTSRKLEGNKDPNNPDFFILVAAEKGQTAAQVAALINEKYSLGIRLFRPEGESHEHDEPEAKLTALGAKSFRIKDPAHKGKLSFGVDGLAQRMAYRYGDKADYFELALKIDDAQRTRIFTDEVRTILKTDPQNPKADSLRYDIILRRSMEHYLQGNPTDQSSESIQRGGLMIYKPGKKMAAAALSDVHIDDAHDELGLAAIKAAEAEQAAGSDFQGHILGRHTLNYISFSNSNDNATALVDDAGRLHAQGEVEIALLPGDTVNCNSVSTNPATCLRDSNVLPLSDLIARTSMPVYSALGNHNELNTCPPWWIQAGDMRIDWTDLVDLDHYRYPFGLDGLVKMVASLDASLKSDERAIWSDLSVLNPFPTYMIDTEGEDGTRHVIAMLDTGKNGLYHIAKFDIFWPDVKKNDIGGTPEYEGVWDFAFQEHMATEGATLADLDLVKSWKPHDVVGHSPLLNGDKLKHYNPDPRIRLTLLSPAGTYWDNTSGGWAHNGYTALQYWIDVGANFWGGHNHTPGLCARASKSGAEPVIEEGRILEARERMIKRLGPNLTRRHLEMFENPQLCKDNPDCPEEIIELYGKDFSKVEKPITICQLGAAGPGRLAIPDEAEKPEESGIRDPIYSIIEWDVSNNQPLVAAVKQRFARKEWEEVPGKPGYYRLTVKVSDKPSKEYPDPAKQWLEMKKLNPQIRIDFEGAKARLLKQLRKDHVNVPNKSVYKEMPHIDFSQRPSFIDALWHHRNLTVSGLWSPLGEPGQKTTWGVTAQLSLDAEILGDQLGGRLTRGPFLSYTDNGLGDRFISAGFTTRNYGDTLIKEPKIWGFQMHSIRLTGPALELGMRVLVSRADAGAHWRVKGFEGTFNFTDKFFLSLTHYWERPWFGTNPVNNQHFLGAMLGYDFTPTTSSSEY